MIRRRLHLQIYATIIFSLILVVFLSAISFWITNRENDDDDFPKNAKQLIINVLPNPGDPIDQQITQFEELLTNIDIDVSLFSEQGQLIAQKGQTFEFPDDVSNNRHWQRYRSGEGWIIQLPDNRWLIANMDSESSHTGPLLKLLLIISSFALGIGLASYPFVKRLTRRLDRLKTGVENMGKGDLKSRVAIEGKDEIATLAESFNNSAEQIERLVTSHKTLLANASHELRTPLSRIKLGLELYQDGHDAKRLEALKTDITELDDLIEEIMLMSRLDDSSRELTLEEINLAALAQEEAQHFSQITVVGDAPHIYGNRKLIRRALRNLIGNAFKHGSPPVIVQLTEENGHVIISVIDHGKGIPSEQQDKIFERFFRGSDRQNVEGYGLGLSLVKQIAQAHDGTAQIKQDEKFTIQISLPV